MKTCDYRQEENVIELILKAKDIRVEFKGRTCLDIDELVSLTNSTQNRKAMRRKLSVIRLVEIVTFLRYTPSKRSVLLWVEIFMTLSTIWQMY